MVKKTALLNNELYFYAHKKHPTCFPNIWQLDLTDFDIEMTHEILIFTI